MLQIVVCILRNYIIWRVRVKLKLKREQSDLSRVPTLALNVVLLRATLEAKKSEKSCYVSMIKEPN